MRIVKSRHSLYELSETAYRNYLEAGASGGGVTPLPTDFGGRLLGRISFDSNDVKVGDYRLELDYLDALANTK
jgi:hypothetical protein